MEGTFYLPLTFFVGHCIIKWPVDSHLFSLFADFGDGVARNTQTCCDVSLADSETFESQDLSVVGHDRPSLYGICTENVHNQSIRRFSVSGSI